MSVKPVYPDGSDARPLYRVLSAILCVTSLAAAMLGVQRAAGGSAHPMLWAAFAAVALTIGVAQGHLALTGRWLLGRNRRL